MSDLSIPTKDSTTENETPPGVMLVTMLLLIGSLLLTSTTMMYYSFDSNKMDSKATLSLNALIQKGKDYTAQIATNKQAVAKAPDTPKEKKEGLDLFSFGNNGKTRWPRLKLTGFGRAAGSQGNFAIINNKPVHLNQKIGNVTLVEIRTHDVVVEYRGERKMLTIATK